MKHGTFEDVHIHAWRLVYRRLGPEELLLKLGYPPPCSSHPPNPNPWLNTDPFLNRRHRSLVHLADSVLRC